MLLIDSKASTARPTPSASCATTSSAPFPRGSMTCADQEECVGRFAGRIWVERDSGNIVRFNGSFSGSEKDIASTTTSTRGARTCRKASGCPPRSTSRRAIPRAPQGTLKFKAVNHIWGYSLKVPQTEADRPASRSSALPTRASRPPTSRPLQAQREWVQQAEDNVIDRLYTAGLIDAPSDFDKILEALANNILAYNNIATRPPDQGAHAAHRAARVRSRSATRS